MKRLFLLVTFIFTIFGLFSCDIDLDNKNTEEPNISDNNDNNSNNSNKDEDSTTEEVEKITLSFEGYYSALNGELDVNFKTKLHTLTESKHKTRGSYDKAWTVLESADEDPNNSNNIICFYTGQSIPKADKVNKGAGSIKWNREHVWPKSLGFSSSGAAAHNDCHHLHATEERINNSRSNKDFKEVNSPTDIDSFGNKWITDYFEPRDEVKGDVARSIFYMVVRYDGDKCNECELDLEIVDGRADRSIIANNKVGRIGDLNTLLKWHYEDPVSEAEKKRNEVVFSYQGNRNPFIDHEEFVSYLYTSLVSEYTDISKFEYLI